MDLTIVWAFIIAFAVAAYVVMDGFDLGIGILFPFFRSARERDQAMNAIAPVWDGNETWLVLGGGGLLAAFPLAYAIILPALYAPLIAMLLGLVFRGVAFEFRWRDPGHRPLVGRRLLPRLAGRDLRAGRDARRAAAGDRGRGPRLCRRLVGLADPVQPADRRRPGRSATPCSAPCWLIWKTEGPLQADARRYAHLLLPALLVAIGAVSLATPFLEPQYCRALVRMAGPAASPCRCRCWSLGAAWPAVAQPRPRPRLAPFLSRWPCSCCRWSASPSRSGRT